MKRTPILLISLLLLSAIGYIIFFKQSATKKVLTSISIIVDYKAKDMPDNQTILADLVKVLKAECNHIFVNPLIWFLLIKEIEQGSIQIDIDAWQLYDTTTGLLYVKHTCAPTNVGINVNTFMHIKKTFDTESLYSVANRNWTDDLDQLFDITQWQQYHSHPESKALLYMCGHGSERADNDPTYSALGCGLPEAHFAQIIHFFSDQLAIDFLSVQSCHWTAERIFDLMCARYNLESLNFNIISPLDAEKTLWLTTLEHADCTCEPCQGRCFFDASQTFTEQYEGQLTEELKNIIADSDTIRHNKEYKQQPTLVMAGSQKACLVV